MVRVGRHAYRGSYERVAQLRAIYINAGDGAIRQWKDHVALAAGMPAHSELRIGIHPGIERSFLHAQGTIHSAEARNRIYLSSLPPVPLTVGDSKRGDQ